MEGSKLYKIITRPAIDSSVGDFFGEVGQIVIVTDGKSNSDDRVYIKLLSPRDSQCAQDFSCEFSRLKEF